MSQPRETYGETYRLHEPAASAGHGDARPAWKPYTPSQPNPAAGRSLAELLGLPPAGATALQQFQHAMRKNQGGHAGAKLDSKRRARTRCVSS